jgi:hypothetical protein
LLPELADDPSVIGGDHGLIAAAHLHASLTKLGAPLAKSYMPAVRAVAFHNTKYPRVDGRKDPVAALLILCDTVQDWSRSQLGYDRSPTVVLSRLVSPAPAPDDEQFGPVRRFWLSVKRSPTRSAEASSQCSSDYSWIDSASLEIRLDYSERVSKGPTAIYNWVDTTFNLRRVDYSGWGVLLRIKHRVPVPDSGGEGRLRLDEFERVALANEAGLPSRRKREWSRLGDDDV